MHSGAHLKKVCLMIPKQRPSRTLKFEVAVQGNPIKLVLIRINFIDAVFNFQLQFAVFSFS